MARIRLIHASEMSLYGLSQVLSDATHTPITMECHP